MTKNDRQDTGTNAPGTDRFHCPRCALDLGDAAAQPPACPACGAVIDADKLRSLSEVGEDLDSPWQVLRRTVLSPKRFFSALPSPRHYVHVPRDLRFYDHVLFVSFFAAQAMAIVAAVRLGSVLIICFTAPAALSWSIALVWAHHATPRRLVRRLARTAHENPSRGAERIMLLSAGGYATMAAAFCLLTAALGGATVVDGRVRGSVELTVALVLYGLAWANWVWIVRRAWQAETRGLGVGSWPALLNAGLLILLLPALVLIVTVASYLTMFATLMG